MRTFVIGDVHGCSKALRTLIEEISPGSDDQVIFLGDYIDRGPNSRDVVDQVLCLQDICKTITLRGNHEIMLLDAMKGSVNDRIWLANGGGATIASYGGSIDRIPDSHRDFFQNLKAYHESKDSIFVHANYDASKPMQDQEAAMTFWTHLSGAIPGPHYSGKRVFVGHTPQADGEIWDLGHLVGLDTYCFGGGYLTAYQLETAETIQADRHGHLRRAPLAILADRMRSLGERGRRWIRKRRSPAAQKE